MELGSVIFCSPSRLLCGLLSTVVDSNCCLFGDYAHLLGSDCGPLKKEKLKTVSNSVGVVKPSFMPSLTILPVA